jgi:hypothetical protein
MYTMKRKKALRKGLNKLITPFDAKFIVKFVCIFTTYLSDGLIKTFRDVPFISKQIDSHIHDKFILKWPSYNFRHLMNLKNIVTFGISKAKSVLLHMYLTVRFQLI